MLTFSHYIKVANVLKLPNSTISFFQFSEFEKDLRSGAFQNAVVDFLQAATNNHGFGVMRYIDVTYEVVSQEASSDIDQTDEEDEYQTARLFPIEE